MIDLRTQLEAYAEHLDAVSPDLDSIDFQARTVGRLTRPAPSPGMRCIVIAFAGAAAVLLLVVGVIALAGRGDRPRATGEVVTTTTARPQAQIGRLELRPAPVIGLAAAPDETALPFMGPGGVLRTDDGYHMFFNRRADERSSVGHASSPDGRSWTAGAELFGSTEVAFAGGRSVVARSAVSLPDGRFAVFFDARRDQDGEPQSVIGVATAANALAPWTVEPEPVLAPGVADFAAHGVAQASVVRIDDRLVMFFAGFAGDGAAAIGHAESLDGITWTVDPEPVLTASLEWERGDVTRPNVVVRDGEWFMLYAGTTLSTHGFASSADGVEWQKLSAEPALTISDVTRAQILDTELAVGPEGQLLVFVENGGEQTSSDVWLLEEGRP